MPVVAISDEASEVKREQRSDRFRAVLKRHGIAEHAFIEQQAGRA